MPLESPALVPAHKLDIARAEAAVAAGYPAVAPLLPALLEWLQDMNWPVAQVLAPFLAGIGAPLETEIRVILGTTDFVWKYWIIQNVIAESPELRHLFRSELERLATWPSAQERSEELNEVAREALRAE